MFTVQKQCCQTCLENKKKAETLFLDYLEKASKWGYFRLKKTELPNISRKSQILLYQAENALLPNYVDSVDVRMKISKLYIRNHQLKGTNHINTSSKIKMATNVIYVGTDTCHCQCCHFCLTQWFFYVLFKNMITWPCNFPRLAARGRQSHACQIKTIILTLFAFTFNNFVI